MNSMVFVRDQNNQKSSAYVNSVYIVCNTFKVYM